METKLPKVFTNPFITSPKIPQLVDLIGFCMIALAKHASANKDGG
jgi:hypothetical protein